MAEQVKMAEKVSVFVYGTLKRGFGNYQRLLEREGVEFLREAQTAPEFTMYSLGGFPGVIKTGQGVVHGEVFSVPVELIPNLDGLEGHPNFYRRTDMRVSYKDGGNEVDVQTYLLPVRKEYTESCPVVESGVWERRRY